MEAKSSYDDLVYNLLYDYIMLDLADYQTYLVTNSTLPSVLSMCLAKSYLTVYSQTPLETFQPSIVLKLILSLPKENRRDYLSFMSYLQFIDRVYCCHFNAGFLRKLSQEIYKSVLVTVFQNQILSASRRGTSQNAIQYLTFILENVSSPKLAQCVFYFLFNFGDIFESASPYPPAQPPEFSIPTEETKSIFLKEPEELKDPPKKETYTPTALTKYLLNQLQDKGNSLAPIIWQLLAQLLSFQLPSFIELIVRHDLHYSTVNSYLTLEFAQAKTTKNQRTARPIPLISEYR
eukprot:TRINITY_DN1888_c0_g1_i10.p1 TRINITY_DN1888_c0_g1~~TRINITY_DN1888_c0_g1_i10.p1  ORF type:complete len:291 (-),score=23.17 TRINITY_DN1888_c0_g1_i10:104-976(-)